MQSEYCDCWKKSVTFTIEIINYESHAAQHPTFRTLLQYLKFGGVGQPHCTYGGHGGSDPSQLFSCLLTAFFVRVGLKRFITVYKGLNLNNLNKIMAYQLASAYMLANIEKSSGVAY